MALLAAAPPASLALASRASRGSFAPGDPAATASALARFPAALPPADTSVIRCGRSHCPDSRPASGRLCSRIHPPWPRPWLCSKNTALASTSSSRDTALIALAGKAQTSTVGPLGRGPAFAPCRPRPRSSTSPTSVLAASSGAPARCSAYALHLSLTGQWAQSGVWGVHTVAPSSISAWLKAPGRRNAASTDSPGGDGQSPSALGLVGAAASAAAAAAVPGAACEAARRSSSP
mmetsp:Transcript_25115/g.94939  ORF Transcript_25115/g.94939 Transcript_25115/m.94939 type:complete len:233 (-) Transcript_25115:98-796(-)